MAGKDFTVDSSVLGKKLGEAAADVTDSLKDKVTSPLQAATDWGFGGEGLEKLLKGIGDFFSKIGEGIGSGVSWFVNWVSSLFGGSSAPTPAATSTIPTAAPETKAETPEPPSPGKLPQKQPAPGAPVNQRGATPGGR